MIYENVENQIRKLFTFQQFPFWVIDSPRGVGKSYAVQDFLLERFFKYGYFFAIIRESEGELKECLSNGFWDIDLIQKKYSNHDFRVVGKFLFIDGIIAGTAVALTTYAKYRQNGSRLGCKENFSKEREEELFSELEEVEKVVNRKREQLKFCFFDEFEPLEPLLKADQRIKAFKHILENLFRMRTDGVRVIMCANVENSFSPMLNMLGYKETCDVPESGFFKSYTTKRKKPLAVRLRVLPDEEWKKSRENSLVGLLSEDSEDEIFYTGAATKGVNYKKTQKYKNKRSIFNLKIDSNTFTVWNVGNENILQITKLRNGTKNRSYAADARNTSNDIQILPKILRKALEEKFRKNLIEYENSMIFENVKSIMPRK